MALGTAVAKMIRQTPMAFAVDLVLCAVAVAKEFLTKPGLECILEKTLASIPTTARESSAQVWAAPTVFVVLGLVRIAKTANGR
jgi:hypothetical protein